MNISKCGDKGSYNQFEVYDENKEQKKHEIEWNDNKITFLCTINN